MVTRLKIMDNRDKMESNRMIFNKVQIYKEINKMLIMVTIETNNWVKERGPMIQNRWS